MKNPQTNFARVTAVLTLLIALAGFILSFTALRDLAAHNGVPDNLAFLFPLLADTVVIAASLSVIAQHLEGQSARFQWGLVIGFTALSVLLNGLHAQREPLSIFLAIVPPLALFLTFELLAVQLQRAVKRSTVHQTLSTLSAMQERAQTDFKAFVASADAQRATLQSEIDTLTVKRDGLVSEVTELRKDRRAVKRESQPVMDETTADMSADMITETADKSLWGLPPEVRKDMIAREVRTANGHGAPSAADIASKYGISVRQARRDLADIAPAHMEVN